MLFEDDSIIHLDSYKTKNKQGKSARLRRRYNDAQ